MMNEPGPLASFPHGGIAVVFGAGGGIGSALVSALEATGSFRQVVAYGRASSPPVDLLDEASIEHAARAAATHGDLRCIIDATGFLHDERQAPEKSLSQSDPQAMARAFAINATGPALLMKHMLGRLPRTGKCVFASLSARVGSIGDNRLGGWYAYRASKAALNQIIRTSAIELARRAPQAICVAVHPGTVDTALSAPFAAAGLNKHAPPQAAAHILRLLDRLTAKDTGGFYDWRGQAVPW